jgi:hypothetical protein
MEIPLSKVATTARHNSNRTQPGWLATGLLALLTGSAAQGGQSAMGIADPAAMLELIAMQQEARVTSALARIAGTDHKLLALRAYLRAGPGLAHRWSWTGSEIHAYRKSTEYAAVQAEIEQVRRAFVAANPGFDLWVNPDIRSLDTQIANWNSNESVAFAAANLLTAFRVWLGSPQVRQLPGSARSNAAARWLKEYMPHPAPVLAAPGLSPHGQMRAIDFQIRKQDRLVAAARTATIRSSWDVPGWTDRLQAAVQAGSTHFSGPLTSPREPWHYTYMPVE